MTHSFKNHLFRLACETDVEAVTALVSDVGPGLTTIPKNRQEVELYIKSSIDFLRGDTNSNRILFVLEVEGEILGISGIIPNLGLERPFYSFSRSRHSRRSMQPDISIFYETLQLTCAFDGYTELATLFMSPKARGLGLGRLLSFGRLAFISAHADQFKDNLMADIRGWQDEKGSSPFWELFVSKFIPTDFDTADRKSVTDGRFIIELLPSIPVLMNLLADEVREVVGQPNENSKPAYNMLRSIGFKPTEHCDVFDGGPSLACEVEDTLIKRTMKKVATVDNVLEPERVLVFTGMNDEFRAVLSNGNLTTATAANEVRDLLGPELNGGLYMANAGQSEKSRLECKVDN